MLVVHGTSGDLDLSLEAFPTTWSIKAIDIFSSVLLSYVYVFAVLSQSMDDCAIQVHACCLRLKSLIKFA